MKPRLCMVLYTAAACSLAASCASDPFNLTVGAGTEEVTGLMPADEAIPLRRVYGASSRPAGDAGFRLLSGRNGLFFNYHALSGHRTPPAIRDVPAATAWTYKAPIN